MGLPEEPERDEGDQAPPKPKSNSCSLDAHNARSAVGDYHAQEEAGVVVQDVATTKPILLAPITQQRCHACIVRSDDILTVLSARYTGVKRNIVTTDVTRELVQGS